MEIDLFEIFCWGIDYGQLLSEEERDNEDLFDAFQGHIISNKYSMPSAPAPRRQPRSEKWREAKKKSYADFIDFLATVKQIKVKCTL